MKETGSSIETKVNQGGGLEGFVFELQEKGWQTQSKPENDGMLQFAQV
jgi:hypothetical protein